MYSHRPLPHDVSLREYASHSLFSEDSMRTVETRAGLVAYEEQGTGTPLLLLHANTGDHRQFEGIVQTLASSYRTIALDWPGFGESAAPNPPQAATAMLMADVLEDVMTHLDLESAILLGHSVGGYAAAR